MEFMKQKWSSGLVLGLLLTALVIGGCTKGDKSVSVTGPSAATLQPRGTVQGLLLDSVTQEPIVNAVISIGVGTGTTDSRGQYVIADVPATYDALNNTWTDHYDITVDLRNVTSPVKMNVATTTPRYPDFDYSSVQVGFTSLNDSNPCDQTSPSSSNTTCGNTNNTNHDTPVTGLVANADMTVGKLDANISGAVYGGGCQESTVLPDYYVAKAGYTVNLLTGYSGSDNSATGKSGHLVGTTTTDANGVFTFNNVEANQYFQFQIMDSVTKPTVGMGLPGTSASSYSTVQSPSDGLTNTQYLEASNALHVCPVNSDGPAIVAFSPEENSDLAPNAAETVTFTFSEPIDQTSPYASIDPSGPYSLHDNIDVVFDGTKGGNIPYTLSWNATFDQLTVTFATASSSYYYVDLYVGNLQDAAGNYATAGACNSGSDCEVDFSTNGGTTPGTPVLTLVNSLNLDEAGGNTSAIFDWPTVSGAKTYNLYCETDEHFPDGTTVQAGSVYLVDSGLTSSDDVVDFDGFLDHDVDSSKSFQVGVQFPCYVTGVNSDGVEGPVSNTQTAKDTLGPVMNPTTFFADDLDSDGQADTISVRFDEMLDETSAETPGNYTLGQDTGTVPTVSAAYLCTDNNVPVTDCQAPSAGRQWVVLTITQQQTTTTINDNAGDTLTVSGVKDVNLNAIRSSGDVMNLFTGVVN